MHINKKICSFHILNEKLRSIRPWPRLDKLVTISVRLTIEQKLYKISNFHKFRIYVCKYKMLTRINFLNHRRIWVFCSEGNTITRQTFCVPFWVVRPGEIGDENWVLMNSLLWYYGRKMFGCSITLL